MEDSTLRVGSYNIRGANEKGKLEKFCFWAEDRQMDIIGIQETKMVHQKTTQLFQTTGSPDRLTGKHNTYKIFWAHGEEGNHMGSGIALLITNFWSDHVIKRGSWKGRGQYIDFSFKTGFRLHIVNCYIPDKSHREHTPVSNWVKSKMQEAREAGHSSILIGDFNGVMDPRKDRALRRGGSQPETSLLQWVQTQALYDCYRVIHPTTPGFTLEETSRIDMIFVSHNLAARFIQCTHDNPDDDLMVDGGKAMSDHIMVNAQFTLHGSQHLTRHVHQKFKKPTGFRFLFQDTEEDDYESFDHNLSRAIKENKDEWSALGVQMSNDKDQTMDDGTVEKDRMAEVKEVTLKEESLLDLDLEQSWTKYSKMVMKAAKENIPGKKVGRSGMKPAAELSAHHLIRSLSRIKQKVGKLKNGDLTSENMQDTLKMEWQKYNDQAEKFNETAELKAEVLGRIPDRETATQQEWSDAHRGVTKWWREALTLLQAVKDTNTQSRIREHIEKHCAQLKTATGKMLDKVLGRSRGKVVIDRVQVEVNGDIVNALEPRRIKDHVQDWFNRWHGPRPSRSLAGTRWEKQYAPIEWVQEEWYDGLMAIPLPSEFEAAVTESPKHKAPGSSGISNELFKNQGKHGKYILYQIVSACIVQQDMPREWKTGIIYCIPKAPEWSGNMAEVRPITLLEHAWKILFSILNRRLSTIFSCHGVLRGPNFSVLKGTTTKDPLHILNAAMEDARENRKELWTVFQDMKHCFDSVNCRPDGMLSRGLTRLKVPRGFIAMCENVALTKTNKVITEYGLTEEYHPECGLDQGGVECPLLWRVAYDPLLCEVMDNLDGYEIQGPTGPIKVNDLAFVDDTTWLGKSKENVQDILDVATSFFDLNGVEINAKKTVVIAINNKDANATLSFGTLAEEIRPIPKKDDTCILGVYVSASGSPQPTIQRITVATESICNTLRWRAVTDRIATYIINSVLLPQVLYRSTLTILPTSTLNILTGKYTKLCKSKSGMPSTTPNSIMHHRNLYGVKRLDDAQAEEQISTLQLWLNDPGLVGTTVRARLHWLQTRNAMAELPTMIPEAVTPYRHCIISKICHVMADRNATFDLNMAPILGLPSNAVTILEWNNGALECEVISELSKLGVLYVDQILEDRTHLMSWRTFWQTHKVWATTSPNWFRSLQDFVHRTTYSGDYLAHWAKQKLEALDPIYSSNEELDHFNNSAPAAGNARSGCTQHAQPDVEYVEDTSESEKDTTEIEEESRSDGVMEEILEPIPPTQPVAPFVPIPLLVETPQQCQQRKQQYINQNLTHTRGHRELAKEKLGIDFEKVEKKAEKDRQLQHEKATKQVERRAIIQQRLQCIQAQRQQEARQ